MSAPGPRFPIYIPSKSRAQVAKTMPILDKMGVPYRIVVEGQQAADYAERFGAERIIVLDAQYQRDYVTCDEHGDSFSKGSGPARNFIWDHSVAEGHAAHWVIDDNIDMFERYHGNQKVPVGDGAIFDLMERFVLRYRNVAMAGPNYHMFAPARQRTRPYVTGTRIYSCILIRNDIPFRWRGRYNEDTDLSIRVLKAGWNTVLFNAYLQHKLVTQLLPGGNTEAFYSVKGTLPKSRMLALQHPDVARVVWRYGRWHHHVDYDAWRNRPLIRRDDVDPDNETIPYDFQRVPRADYRGHRVRRPTPDPAG